LIEPSCLSYELTLPNKLFEYVAAGLPVLASDLPVMGDFVQRYGVGLLTDAADPNDIADKLRRILDPERNAQLRAAAARARAELSWPAERRRLAKEYALAAGGG
jgi:glycosyltransferase involved in cell wall biosynthesis